MSTTITNINSVKVLSNLDTYVYTTTQSSLYTARITVSEIPPSGIILTIKQNSSTIATTTVAPAASQSTVELRTVMNITSGDTISVVIASSSNSDKGTNAFKGILQIAPGSI